MTLMRNDPLSMAPIIGRICRCPMPCAGRFLNVRCCSPASRLLPAMEDGQATGRFSVTILKRHEQASKIERARLTRKPATKCPSPALDL